MVKDPVMPLKTKPKALVMVMWLIMVITCLLTSRNLHGAQSEHEVIARNFLAFVQSNKQIGSIVSIEGSVLDSSNPILIAHLVTLEGGGYILISASKDLTPIKAYSLHYNFDTLPDNYKKYLLLELEYAIRTLDEGNQTGDQSSRYKSSDDITATTNRERWEFLAQYTPVKKRLRQYEPDTFLIKTHWVQKSPYNKFLPQIGGKPVKVGCTNIAVGQLMKYYKYPPSGQGVETYTWNGQQLKAIFYKNYHWENMPNSLTAISPEFQTDETARLLRDIAVANHTQFGVDASTANVNIEALTRYFGYARGIRRLTNSSESTFFAVLRNEIDNFRPVLLRFPGHMTIADGYSSNATGREIHVNFGWGEHNDGYYFLDKTVVHDAYPTPFSTDPGNLEIYYNIKPCSGDDCDTNRESEDYQIQGITIITINGKFDTATDIDEYNVYLKGFTRITGLRKYSSFSNRSFIVSIYVDHHNLIVSNDGSESILTPAVATTLSAGKYTLTFSLCREIESCYPYEPYKYYTATVTTQSLTSAEKNTINNRDISPVMNNNFVDLILDDSGDPFKILIDAVDEDGDSVTLHVTGTNDHITTSIDNDILTISAKDGITHQASKITVSASAGSKTVHKSFIVLTANENIQFGKEMTIEGLFENQGTFNKHTVVLDGTCTISGDNGYANQGFYTSVMDMNEQYIITPIDDEIQGYFTGHQFLVGASLKYGGYQYTYHDGQGDVYTIEISCPESNLALEDIASMLHISLQGTGLKNPPSLLADMDKTCGTVPLQVQFHSYSQDYDGDIVSYEWDFGNGDRSLQMCPSYTFTEHGSHVICCTVTDNDGLTAFDTVSINVSRNKIKVGNREGIFQESCFEQWFTDGQNRVYMYNSSCLPYTSFDFLTDLKEEAKSATVRHQVPESGSFAQSYWFFGRICGQERDLPEETEFSEEITPSEDAFYAIDIIE